MLVNLRGIKKVTARFASGAKGVYYYHRKSGKRLPDDPASAEFAARMAEIEAEQKTPEGVAPGTLEALIVSYKASVEFQQLAEKTRKDYGRYLEILRVMWGRFMAADFSRRHVKALRDKFSKTPRTANYLVQVFRILMSLAIEEELRETNPASRARMLRTGEGHRPWEEAEIEAFRARWPATASERVAFELLLNGGQRGEDTVVMNRRHYRNGWLSVKQLKTTARVDVPASNDLIAVLDPFLSTHNGLTLLADEHGKPFRIDNFRHVMRAAYDAAGLPKDCTTHGLRYTCATVLHELGCDWETVAAIVGHETVAMVRKYTGKRRLARLAIGRLNRARSEQERNTKVENAADPEWKMAAGTKGERGDKSA